MLYQGEDIAITVTFDQDVLEQAQSFIMLVYPTFNVNGSDGWNSGDVEKENVTDGKYTFTIPYGSTKDMPTGQYTIEVLMKSGSGTSETRSIFQNTDAFTLQFAKAKTIS